MIKARFLRSAALCVATLVAAGATSVLGAGTAMAATGSAVTFGQMLGQDTTVFTVSTPAACPAGDPDIQAVLTGGDFPASPIVYLVDKGPISAWPTDAAGGSILTVSNTLRTLASDASVPLLDPGADATPQVATKYSVDVQCVPLFGTSDEDFPGTIWFTSETSWQTVDPTIPVPPTTTTLSVSSPLLPFSVYNPITLTATVSPATAVGAVTFYDDGTALGGAVPVSGGTASSTSHEQAGNYSITAEFRPTNPALDAVSTSPAQSFSVSANFQQQTSTSLLVSPVYDTQQFSPVLLTSTVVPSSAAGTVTFYDGTSPLGTVAVSGGTAVFDAFDLALGFNSLTAAFTPTDPTSYAPSTTSPPIEHFVTVFTFADSESISTTLPPGSLVISIPNQQVALPSPVLNSDATMFTASGALQPITVTDNRAGNPGWTVSGLVGSFSDGAAQISAENLGWTPTAATGSPGQLIIEGPVVDPADGVAPSDPGALGLSTSQTLASAVAGSGLGTARLGAGLNLDVPTSTTAGTYTATLILTAI